MSSGSSSIRSTVLNRVSLRFEIVRVVEKAAADERERLLPAVELALQVLQEERRAILLCRRCQVVGQRDRGLQALHDVAQEPGDERRLLRQQLRDAELVPPGAAERGPRRPELAP